MLWKRPRLPIGLEARLRRTASYPKGPKTFSPTNNREIGVVFSDLSAGSATIAGIGTAEGPRGLCSCSHFAVPDLTKLDESAKAHDALLEEFILFRMFIVGVVLGVAAAGALLYFVPVVDHGRERSIIAVQPNGGNREVFHVNLPADRVFAGRAGADTTFPPGVEWPEHLNVDNAQIELFKVRDAEERVIGIASRVTARGVQRILEWAVHLPARGSLYLLVDNNAGASGSRAGRLRAGTREFAQMRGTIIERYVADGADVTDSGSGRLELVTRLVGTDVPEYNFGEQTSMVEEQP